MAEWGSMFKTCFKVCKIHRVVLTGLQEGKMTQFHGLKERMTLLLEMRKQIMAPNTPPEVRETLKVLHNNAAMPAFIHSYYLQGKTLDKIEEVRGLMGQDLTPVTTTGDIADESNTGVVALYHLVPCTMALAVTYLLIVPTTRGKHQESSTKEHGAHCCLS